MDEKIFYLLKIIGSKLNQRRISRDYIESMRHIWELN